MKRLLLLFLLVGGVFAGCNSTPEPKPDNHYQEDITGDNDSELEEWW